MGRAPRGRWVGLAVQADLDATASGEDLFARAGRSSRKNLAAALLRAQTKDELGAIVGARGREIGTGIAVVGLFLRDRSGWRLAGTGRPTAAPLARWLETSPDRRALLARAGRRASPLVLGSRAALLRQAPPLAGLRAPRSALGAATLVPVKQGRRVLGCLLLGFRQPLRETKSALDAGGLLASICAAALRRLARVHDRVWPAPADVFVGMAAHELKSPIASALVHLGVLKHALARTDLSSGAARSSSTGKSPSLRLSLDSVAGELGRLHRLVRFLGDVARERYRPDLIERLPTDLAPLIREAARAAAREAEQAPRIRLALDGPLWVACDAAQIERVIDNLLSNAIKYGGGKPIELVARRARAHVIVRVRDRGIGVGRADGARIFDPLGRSDVARSYPGLGLGLWLARTIVEAHGGSVRVTGGGGGGGPGGGSVFEISLPRIPTPGT